jgi:type VI secretion system protein ImpL
MILLRDQVFSVCERTITDRYPFVKGAKSEVPLADFAKLFSPNGVIDKFFTQNLAPYADTSGTHWVWRTGSGVDPSLSPTTLREFQRASEIRDAYFQSGGNMPMVTLSVTPPSVAVPGANVRLEVGGVSVASPAPPSALNFPTAPQLPAATGPVSVQWPGASLRTAISATLESAPASVLERTGPWSMFRMIEAGSPSYKPETATTTVTYIVGGHDLKYRISSGSSRNPLNLSALREFHCPGGI